MQALPDELWDLIITFLEVKYLPSCSGVCKHFYSLCEEASVWQVHCRRFCRPSFNLNKSEVSWKQCYRKLKGSGIERFFSFHPHRYNFSTTEKSITGTYISGG
eukprot:TRINITY_DN5634_c0_g1_i1.p1 TRINITY_DN5634_c0_g1~~TRINITY_DN5634_c0_g1_i1.p1  ORF type:complete len:103 (-),score=5.40 TRINITY_DN5634_c0_g1_i1:11-319(-)